MVTNPERHFWNVLYILGINKCFCFDYTMTCPLPSYTFTVLWVGGWYKIIAFNVHVVLLAVSQHCWSSMQ